ncbi:CAMK family protein kinase [Tritrichomonas foetus]|uniref:CAMK family protein kinase n=1 Tax=Tritrichomonas foetus TaxID=1144522 RepID=A0A1J4KMF5_9EUKA|nr:CAMK family protein kinase [Tritrichomonas foetus]|eukprot:OHT10980.1 CAMK family protein kinase [Tritrichomonas foetus]
MSSEEEEVEMNIVCPKSIGQYKIHGTIGYGAFSQVKLCQHMETRQYYACKIVPRSRLNTQHLETRFEIEIRINQQLHHPGIVQMIDLFMDEDNYYVIMEFCPNGDLFQYVVDRGRLNEVEAKPIFRQILETIQYLHQMGVSHRDMKPENILIDRYGRIKISDFGLSRFLGKNNLVDTPCGSPCYASPECISGRSYNGLTTDIWSCGVILFAMVTGQLPWTKRNQNQLFQQIKRGEYTIPGFISREGRNMIKSLMTVNIEQRYTVDEALNDPWLNGIPQQLNSHDIVGYVSMRQVDQYFNREISVLDLPNIKSLKKCVSFSELAQNILKVITNRAVGSSSPKKRKKHHRRETSDGRRHHHRRSSSGEKDKEKRRRKKEKDSEPESEPVVEEIPKSNANPHLITFSNVPIPVSKRPQSRRRIVSQRPPSAKILPSALATKPK